MQRPMPPGIPKKGRPVPETVKQRAARRLMKAFSPFHRWVYRRSRGRLGARWSTGRIPVLLLTTTGRRSGRSHSTPVGYLPIDGRLVLIASYGGVPEHPAWYLNVVAEPDVAIELNGNLRRMRAELAEGEQRARLWAEATTRYPMFIGYQEQVSRELPVIILHAQPGTSPLADDRSPRGETAASS